MPIRPFLTENSFDPEAVASMSEALEQALGQLHGEMNDFTKEAIALLIISAAKAGERDVARLCAAGLRFEPRRLPDISDRHLE